MKEMLIYFIDQKLLTLNDLNDLIRSFPYGKSDVKNKPALITLKTLKSSDHLLKQTASQCWCLGHLLPLMIGHIIPVDNDHWNNFCLLLTIMDYLFALTISPNAINYLRIIIAEHHESFQQLHQNCSFVPKMHYMVHYLDWIQRVGPLVRAWCMRFEGKHTYFKNLAHRMNCFKNVCKTFAVDHRTAWITKGGVTYSIALILIVSSDILPTFLLSLTTMNMKCYVQVKMSLTY
uniref:Uncharacterized protein n=1 Tax=Amphimedon queenslandica TaxID=400682 RepID=A0A1X7U1C6_AMPQE